MTSETLAVVIASPALVSSRDGHQLVARHSRSAVISTTQEIAPARSRSPLFPEAVPVSRLAWSALVWQVAAYGVTVVFAVQYATWPAVCFAVVIHILAGGGITLGAHRYFSHASFRAPLWFENWLAFWYTVSFDRCGQGLISWVAAHKFHHAHSDEELDPHSPQEGFWHSFCGHHLWRREDLFDYETYKQLCPELTARPWLVWFNKTSTVWGIQAAFALVVFVAGGLCFRRQGAFDLHMATSFLVWGVFVRWSFTQTLHGLVDTINHGFWFFQKLPDTYGTRCESKNNATLWLPQLGNETWHNIHHAFPRAANNGTKWYRWDADSILMWIWEKIGLVRDCQWISEADLARREQHAARKATASSESAPDPLGADPLGADPLPSGSHADQLVEQATLL